MVNFHFNVCLSAERIVKKFCTVIKKTSKNLPFCREKLNFGSVKAKFVTGYNWYNYTKIGAHFRPKKSFAK